MSFVSNLPALLSRLFRVSNQPTPITSSPTRTVLPPQSGSIAIASSITLAATSTAPEPIVRYGTPNAIFEFAVANTLHHEGHLVDDPQDPGGITNMGISLRFLRSIEPNAGDLDGDGDVDQDDVRNITVEQAKKLYYEQFWLPSMVFRLNSELLAVKIFDMAVNLGRKRAWTIVQESLFDQNIIVDGVVGPQTLAAVNRHHNDDFLLLAQIRRRQADFYVRLIDTNPVREKYRTGWMRRAAA